MSQLRDLAESTGAGFATDTSFADLTTLRLGGRPAATVTCSSTESLISVVRALDQSEVPLVIVGGGSNLVVTDDPLELVAVRAAARAVEFDTSGERPFVYAEAGAVWDELVAETTRRGLGGLECLSAIPGSVGATPVQNVGAYGVEVAQRLKRVQLLDRRDGTVSWVQPASLGLRYRSSRLKGNDDGVVLAVELYLEADGLSAPVRYPELARSLGATAGERVQAAAVRDAVLGLRAAKGMVLSAGDHDTWSAGSFFTNPIVDDVAEVRARVAERLGEAAARALPAYAVGEAGAGHGGAAGAPANGPGGGASGGAGGAEAGPAGPSAELTERTAQLAKLSAAWLIERAGFAKGYPGSGAPVRLSTKHTLALTHRGGGTTRELRQLALEIRGGVEEAFGVRLESEPLWLGIALD